METSEASPIYWYAKRALFIIDRTGTIKFIRVMDNPLDLLSAKEVLQTLRNSGA